VISKLGFNPSLTENDFNTLKPHDLTEKVYQEALSVYGNKIKHLIEKTFPVFGEIAQRGAILRMW
jgi:hypothetical protein